MSRENAARRNSALRKIRKSSLSAEIKNSIEVIIDHLSPKSDYRVARPSATAIAARNGRSRRTGQWHVKIIKQLGIFRCLRLSPQAAMDHCEKHFGFPLDLSKCGHFGPNLYIVEASHPLWDKSRTLPKAIEKEWSQIVATVKANRNAKTTSRLSADAAKQPQLRHDELRQRRIALESEVVFYEAMELLHREDAERRYEEYQSLTFSEKRNCGFLYRLADPMSPYCRHDNTDDDVATEEWIDYSEEG